MQFFTNSTSSLEQYTLARFIKNGHFERHLNKIRRYYREEGEQLFAALRENKDIHTVYISGVESGTHLLVKLDTELKDRQLKLKTATQGVNIACLSDFCITVNHKYDHIMILNFSDLDKDTQQEAIKRIGRVFV